MLSRRFVILTVPCCIVDITLTGLTPLFGPIGGDTTVTIIGSNFVNTGTIVARFVSGSTIVDVRPATFISASTVSCKSPAFGSTGPYTVQVALNGQSFVSSTSANFTVYGMITVRFCFRELTCLCHSDPDALHAASAQWPVHWRYLLGVLWNKLHCDGHVCPRRVQQRQ